MSRFSTNAMAALLALLAGATSACGTTASSAATYFDIATAQDTAQGVDVAATADTSASDTAAADVPAAQADAVAADVPAAKDVVATADVAAADVGAPPADIVEASGTCSNDADKTIIASGSVDKAVTDCAMSSMGDAAKATPCIKKATGLSDGCVTCFAGALSCTFSKCLMDCMGGNTPSCAACRAKNCDAAFTTCSGLKP